MAGGLSVAVWVVWGVGSALIVILGLVCSRLITVLRRFAPPVRSRDHSWSPRTVCDTSTLIPFFAADFLGKPAWVWLTFIGIVVALLAFDLGVLHKDDHEIGVRESLLLSAGYISVALVFGAWVWWYLGAQSGMDYYTGFMIEKSLSMDNVFVIALIFSFFAIPRQYQHRVLFWGILGVIVLRAIMIGLGATLVSQFSWVLYLFGAFLIFTGIKMWIIADHVPDIAKQPAAEVPEAPHAGDRRAAWQRLLGA